MLILAAKLRIYTKYLDSSFSGKRCLSIRNHKPQTSYSGKRRDEMFRDEAYEMGSGWSSNQDQIKINYDYFSFGSIEIHPGSPGAHQELHVHALSLALKMACICSEYVICITSKYQSLPCSGQRVFYS